MPGHQTAAPTIPTTVNLPAGMVRIEMKTRVCSSG